MHPVLRLRITLADRSGALAQAATVIGLHGGNIRSVDVHRAAEGSAVDDLVVEFPVDPDMEAMSTDLAMHASATLISCTPADALDPVESALGDALAVLGGGSLAAALARLCAAPSAWTLPAEEAAGTEVGRAATTKGGVAWMRTDDLPDEVAAEVSEEAAVLAVNLAASGRGGPAAGKGAVAFVARAMELGFTDTEVARVQALVAIALATAG